MRSDRPKPLHRLCGRPMISYVLGALPADVVGRAVLVVGHGAERVTKSLQAQDAGLELDFVEQHVQRGTGDAVSVGLTAFSDEELDGDGHVIVMPGDHPLLRPETVAALIEQHCTSDAACTILTVRMSDPTGYGRVVRDSKGAVRRIVEHRDATPEEREIDEVNTSIYCFRTSLLAPALRRLSPENSQGEYYLTDVIEVFVDAGYQVGALVAEDEAETQGVNDRRQLAEAEAELRRRTNLALLAAGVTMVDPTTTYVDTTVEVAPDVTLFPNTLLQGTTVVGERSEIGPNTRIVDSVVGKGCRVESSTVRDAEVGDDSIVGPYAYLEAGSGLAAGSRTGAFYTGASGGGS